MPSIKRNLPRSIAVCALLLASGCATQPDVGEVVVAPQVKLPPIPQVVLETEPLPVGYFQQRLANYLLTLPAKPTN